MTTKKIALVSGDGSAPEMMEVACFIAQLAAHQDNLQLEFVPAPMGWAAYDKFGDTLPADSLAIVKELGTVFFGAVGNPDFDNTIGQEHPEMKPEARCLLTLRQELGLLINTRPMIYYPELAHLAQVRPEVIPSNGIEQIWLRYLLEDSYFGTRDLAHQIVKTAEHRRFWGLVPKEEVDPMADRVTELAYYSRERLLQYFRYAFKLAVYREMPLIVLHKANVMSRYEYWLKVAREVADDFGEVEVREQLVDSACALLFTPAALQGVIACGNEHGDILSDGAARALGSMGLMCSSSINPKTGQAMFESGAGTAPTLAGQDKANPIGRILTAAMMLRHFGAWKGAAAIEQAVQSALKEGWRTLDLAPPDYPKEQILGTTEIGMVIVGHLSS